MGLDMSKDYISVDVVGTVVSEPKPCKNGYSFFLENKRGENVLIFFVVVRDSNPIDVNEGDRIFITKAGLFISNGKNCLAVIEGSNIEVIRQRCNLGKENV